MIMQFSKEGITTRQMDTCRPLFPKTNPFKISEKKIVLVLHTEKCVEME